MELAFLIDKARWNEGSATEAALAIADYAERVLGLERLICLTMPGNVASMRVARKADVSFARELVDEFDVCHVHVRSP